MRICLPKEFNLLVSLVLAQVAAECVEFVTNGPTAASYDFHRFFDFRNLHEDSDSASNTTATDEKSKIFSTAPWNAGWEARSWFRPATQPNNLDIQYTPSSIFINNDTSASLPSTHLTLHTTLLPNNTQLAAELDYTTHNVTHASIRMLACVHGSSGAVAGFFTYHNDTNESDIEILTRDPTSQIHFTNHPVTDDADAPIPGSTFNVSLKTKTSTGDWHVYRLDWVNGRSAWYVDGKVKAETRTNVPAAESMVVLNMWSNGGQFSERMEEGGEAWLAVRWVELVFNITGRDGSERRDGAGVKCSVEAEPGVPVPARSSGASMFSRGRIEGTVYWWAVGRMLLVSLITSRYFL